MSDSSYFDMIIPSPGRVIVDFEEPAEQTSGGIIIPTQAQRSEDIGRVLAVGAPLQEAGFKRVPPLDIAPGDEVVAYWQWGRKLELTIEGEKRVVYVFNFSDIVGKVKR